MTASSKTFIKVIVFLLLLILFLKFYFIGQVNEYLKFKKTFSQANEERTLNLPNMLLCSNAAYKKSMKIESNVTSDRDIKYTDAEKGEYMIKRFQEISYVLDTDFTLSFKEGSFEQKLQVGKNFILNQALELIAVDTFHSGMCYLIKMGSFHAKGFLVFELNQALQDIDKADFVGKGLTLILTDENGWQTFVLKSFKYFKPKDIPLKLGFHQSIQYSFSISVVETKLMAGSGNKYQCFTNLLNKEAKKTCQNPCMTLGTFALANVTQCKTQEQANCMDHHYKIIPRLGTSECMKSRVTSKYNTRVDSEVTDLKENNTKMEIVLGKSIISDLVETREERYILSTLDFIGSIGGSLGLFLGFSFFTQTCDIIDALFNFFVLD